MEKSIFRKTFGDSPAVRVLDFLLGSPEFDFSLSEISRETGVSWITLNKIWPLFVKMEIVNETRQIGRAKMFMLNRNSEIVNDLIDVERSLVKKFCEDEHIENHKEIPCMKL